MDSLEASEVADILIEKATLGETELIGSGSKTFHFKITVRLLDQMAGAIPGYLHESSLKENVTNLLETILPSSDSEGPIHLLRWLSSYTRLTTFYRTPIRPEFFNLNPSQWPEDGIDQMVEILFLGDNLRRMVVWVTDETGLNSFDARDAILTGVTTLAKYVPRSFNPVNGALENYVWISFRREVYRFAKKVRNREMRFPVWNRLEGNDSADQEIADPAASDPSLGGESDSLISCEGRGALFGAIKELSPSRQAVVLAYTKANSDGDLSWEEFAEIYEENWNSLSDQERKRKTDALKHLYHRALKDLKNSLQQHGLAEVRRFC